MHGQKNFTIFVLEILLKYQVTNWWLKNLLMWSNKEADFFLEIKKRFHYPWNGPVMTSNVNLVTGPFLQFICWVGDCMYTMPLQKSCKIGLASSKLSAWKLGLSKYKSILLPLLLWADIPAVDYTIPRAQEASSSVLRYAPSVVSSSPGFLCSPICHKTWAPHPSLHRFLPEVLSSPFSEHVHNGWPVK